MDMLTSEEIKALRKALNWSPTKFGGYFGVSSATVHYWEANRCHPRWDTMAKINDLREDLKAGRVKPEVKATGNGKGKKKEMAKA